MSVENSICPIWITDKVPTISFIYLIAEEQFIEVI